MERDSGRMPGGEFGAYEWALPDLLCSGDWQVTREIRQQAAHAQWGGWKFDECGCSLAVAPDDPNLARIPPRSGGPFATLEVIDGDIIPGDLNLWEGNGVIDPVDYMPFDSRDEGLSLLEQTVGRAFN